MIFGTPRWATLRITTRVTLPVGRRSRASVYESRAMLGGSWVVTSGGKHSYSPY